MLSRSVRISVRCTCRRPIHRQWQSKRAYSNGPKIPTAHAPSSDHSAVALKALVSDLDKVAPRFDVKASQIRILESPSEFYETLKSKIQGAQRHIFLSTLYIGKDEHELIATLREALKKNPQLTVSILTDALRGTREDPNPSCMSLVASLKRDFPDRVEGRMFHTPNLIGFIKSRIPKRINEGWGLQHMKLYGVDDEIILSGANLSNDYFTNRQDRYHLISSDQVTQYYRNVYQAICKLCLAIEINPETKQPILQRTAISQSLDDTNAYIKQATNLLAPLIKPTPAKSTDETDTKIYPLFQFTPVMKPDTSTELPALKLLLKTLSTKPFAGSSWMFTAGYFNMTPEIRDLLLQTSPASGTVLAASPWANGFYGSKGVSGMLPAAYTYMARQFLGAVTKVGLSDSIKLKEWRLGTVNTPGGWTYHAKGVWVTLPKDMDPSVTLVGSSNYTKRSYSLDLEANALIVTENPDLKRRLGEEQKWLQKHAAEVTKGDFEKTDRRVGLHVRIAMWIVTAVGGAL
ncbi:hypothetical protein ANO11243_048720 [Dothideomycetidae sp. 11243]|nr:hypothetical protein ANO11243_048720 [fungal sp. No.11243]